MPIPCWIGAPFDKILVPVPGPDHYNDVIMSMMASQITSVSIVDSTVCSGTDQRKHQSFASVRFARGIPRSPVSWKMFPFDDDIMTVDCMIPPVCPCLVPHHGLMSSWACWECCMYPVTYQPSAQISLCHRHSMKYAAIWDPAGW